MEKSFANSLPVLFLSLCLFLSACMLSTTEKGTVTGAAAGAAAGQAIGGDSKSTMLGMAAGAALGTIVGQQMEAADRTRLTDAYEYTPDNYSSKWVNEDTQAQYEVTPKKSYVDAASGHNCRQAEILSRVNGEITKTTATACRQNGAWVFQ